MADFEEEADFTGIFQYCNILNLTHEELSKIAENIKNYLSNNPENVNAKNFSGSTLLHGACRFHSFESVKLLVECGADVNIQNVDGNTPIFLCKISNCPTDMIVFLVEECGADVHMKGNCGRSFYDLALNCKVEWLVKLIEENTIKVKPAKRD
jgi:ankyrin repeat protein